MSEMLNRKITDAMLNRKVISSTKKSIIDCQFGMLALFDEEKVKSGGKYKERRYRGKVRFSITEYETGKKAEFYMDKDEVKMLMKSVLDHKFPNLFPSGFQGNGGSQKNGVITARQLNLAMKENEFRGKKNIVFTIQMRYGPGETNAMGGYKITKEEGNAYTQVAYNDMLTFAQEIYDFIRDFENFAMSKGVPLYTIVESTERENFNYTPEKQTDPAPTPIPKPEEKQESTYIDYTTLSLKELGEEYYKVTAKGYPNEIEKELVLKETARRAKIKKEQEAQEKQAQER